MKLIFRFIFFVSLFFFQSFLSYASPDGKGLLCKCVKCNFENDIVYKTDDLKTYDLGMKEIGIYFQNKGAQVITFKRHNDEIVKGGLMLTEYHTNDNEIKWLWFTLNRETLILKSIYPNSNVRQCVLYSNKDKLDNAMYDLFIKYQNKLNLKLKKNKL